MNIKKQRSCNLYIRLAKNVATVDGVWGTSELVTIVIFHADVTGACRLEDKWHGRCGTHNNMGRLGRQGSKSIQNYTSNTF